MTEYQLKTDGFWWSGEITELIDSLCEVHITDITTTDDAVIIHDFENKLTELQIERVQSAIIKETKPPIEIRLNAINTENIKQREADRMLVMKAAADDSSLDDIRAALKILVERL